MVKVLDERIGQFKDVEYQIRAKWRKLSPVMDERRTRLWAGAEAHAIGDCGIAVVARATGLSRVTIAAGMHDLDELSINPPTDKPHRQRVRRPGGGRKPLTETDPTLLDDLESLLDPATRGDPGSPLRWTSKSTRKLANELRDMGHEIGPSKVCSLLKEQGYSLQANRKTREGADHPDRDAQFEYINEQADIFQAEGQPVISVDTKKKELVGNFKNGGREWEPKGEPVPVRTHDFPDPELGKAIPYGIYDIERNEALVSVGINHDTSEFAVEAIMRWWKSMGSKAYPDASDLLITADSGGSNGSRNRLWKSSLQDFADNTGLTVTVCHLPPGTSKWNKIEHRLFSHITHNWRGRPLESVETIVQLIAATTTRSGLKVCARLDRNAYSKGIRISDDEMAQLAIERHDFHGNWNYTISPSDASAAE